MYFEFLFTHKLKLKMKWIVMIIFKGNLFLSYNKKYSFLILRLNIKEQILYLFNSYKQKLTIDDNVIKTTKLFYAKRKKVQENV